MFVAYGHLDNARRFVDNPASEERNHTMPKVQAETIGQQIRAARLSAGMSQTDVENTSGIPKARLSRYENDHIMPSLQSLARICVALGVRPGKLVDAVF